jgi:hypothetical protein
MLRFSTLRPGYSVNVLSATPLPGGFVLVVSEEVKTLEVTENILLPFGVMQNTQVIEEVSVWIELVDLSDIYDPIGMLY